MRESDFFPDFEDEAPGGDIDVDVRNIVNQKPKFVADSRSKLESQVRTVQDVLPYIELDSPQAVIHASIQTFKNLSAPQQDKLLSVFIEMSQAGENLILFYAAMDKEAHELIAYSGSIGSYISKKEIEGVVIYYMKAYTYINLQSHIYPSSKQ